MRPHDGSLDLVCTQERILKIFKITGLTKVLGIYQTVDQAIAAKEVSNSRQARGVGETTITPTPPPSTAPHDL